MSSLSSTAEEILQLVGRGAAHTDPKVARAILITDIEDALYRSEPMVGLRDEIDSLEREKRQLERTIEDLEGELDDLEALD
jgi:cell division protein FtsB